MPRPRVLLALVFCAAVGCSFPATTFEAYRSKAVDAAEEVASQARTAILTAHLARQDRLLASAVAVQLEDAETAAVGAVQSFASVQPPDGRADRLRGRILAVLQRASDTITRMRFEARRGGVSALSQLSDSLATPTARLEDWVLDSA
jgi:signal transduction histidine kinase